MSTVQEAPFQLPASPAPADLIAKYFRVLADPSRLKILELLRAEGELPFATSRSGSGSASRASPTISPACAGAASSIPVASTAPSSTSSPTNEY
jgi:DNA-binding transcriptional ArsR family regulator